MNTKEINVEVSKSKNYQTYKVGKVIILDENEDQEPEIQKVITQGAQAWCRKRVMEQMELDQ